MASTPLILTLTVLTATILMLLILWVFIRYTKVRHARSAAAEPQLQLDQDTAYAAENGESRVHLHCTYQPSGAPHAASHDQGASRHGGVELQSVERKGREGEGDRAEVWLKRGASRDNLRRVDEEDGSALGMKMVKG